MKDIDLTIDHILLHFIGSKAGLYVSFRIRLYLGVLVDSQEKNSNTVRTPL